jgi:hypothetical protein
VNISEPTTKKVSGESMKDISGASIRLELSVADLVGKARLADRKDDVAPEEISRIKLRAMATILKIYDLLDNLGIKTIRRHL